VTAAQLPSLQRRRRSARRGAPLALMAAATALALVAVACTSAAGGGSPTFTYAPPAPSASTMPGTDMGPSAGAPVSPAAPAASGPVAAEPSPASSSAAAAAQLHISAQNIAFDTNHLEAPAGKAFVLEFDNNDPGIPHNVEIKDATGASLFKGQIITGPAKTSYQVPALAAGSYTFVCDVHPNMTGTLKAS